MKRSLAFPVYKDPGGETLLVGTWDAALDEAFLKMHNVGLIVNCNNRDAEKGHPCDYYSLNVNFVGTSTRQGLPTRLPQRVAEAKRRTTQTFRNRKSVLYHCVAGIHRSVAYPTYEIAERTNISFGAAHSLIVRQRLEASAKQRRPQRVGILGVCPGTLAQFEAPDARLVGREGARILVSRPPRTTRTQSK